MANSIKKGLEDVLYPRSPSQAVKEEITDKSNTDVKEYDRDGNVNHDLDFELEAYEITIECFCQTTSN